MKKEWKILLGTGILLAAAIVLYTISVLNDRIPSNNISVTGNTGGNLKNKGLFVEADGKVYFSNAYDGGCLYSMNTNETEITKLGSSRATYLNVGGDYIYYYMDSSDGGSGMGYVIPTRGVYRCKLNGRDSKCLDRTAAITMQLSGDYIYYQHYNNKDYTQLYKIKTNKSEKQLVSDSVINPAACADGIIYFNGTERDHYLYGLDTRTDSIYTIYEGDLWYPVYHQGYIYYMDVSSNYRLCRYSLSANTVEILTNDRVDCFNVGDYSIYYQKNSTESPALMRMNLDGSNPEVVAEGNYENINLTTSYAYFNAFGADTPVYHTPVNGPVNVTTFSGAMEVAAP